jgi:hypothetical protein
MQTLQVIETIKWIEGKVSTRAKKLLLTTYEEGTMSKREPTAASMLASFSAFQDLAVSRQEFVSRPDAVEVLRAFGCSALVDEKFIYITLPEIVLKASSQDLLAPAIAWRRMIDTVDAWRILTIPTPIQGEVPSPKILSFQLHYSTSSTPDLTDLSKATALITDIYEAVSMVDGQKSARLGIIKIDSGSAIRLDLEGLPETIKHVKDFFFEAWQKLRNWKVDQIHENNQALLESLEVLTVIKQKETEGVLTSEVANNLRTRLLQSVLGLFRQGVLLTDIPAIEETDNQRLLSAIAPKLLAAPTTDQQSTIVSVHKKPPSHRRKSR